MRITNNIIRQTSLTNVQKNLQELYKAQEQVTTGKRINRASDDPIGTSMTMETRSSIRAIDQYVRGIDIASSRATAEETVLDKVSDILIRAKELSITLGNDSVSADQRATGAIEIEQLLRETVSLANTKYGEGYLFAGTGADNQPYDAVVVGTNLDFTTTSPSGTVEIQVSANHSIAANHNGVEVFEDTGVLTSLRDLAIALKSGDRDAVIGTIDEIDTAFNGVQNLIGTVGSRASSLQITGANVDALRSGLEVLQSDMEDVEVEKAITELMSRQTSYQAALLTTSKIMGLTLADYLR